MTYARRLWPAYETYHAHIYFVPEAAEAYRELGLKGGWMGYFASRSAALGAASPGLVTAVFFNFHPAMVARALPDAWALAGRPLFGALRSLPWPDEAHLALWHACTLLREHRGDGHVAALTAAGLDGCEAHVTVSATGAIPRETLQANRKWSDEEWTAGEERLKARGWLDAHGGLTDAGRAGRAEVEARTDTLAEEPWRAIGPERTERLLELLTPMARAINAAGGVPVPNPVGVPAP